jgi:hypothetical protein
MKQGMFREIHEGEDVSDIVKKALIFFALAVVVTFLLISGWTLMQTTTDNTVENYREELIQREADPAWQAEEKRLKKKHGDQVPIYEPGKTPYYRCGHDGKEKCKYL